MQSPFLVPVPSLIVDKYHEIFAIKRDTRVDGWFLMGSIWPTLALCLLYVIFVKYVGPWCMKSRIPFEFRKILIAYNAFQVAFSLWLFYEFGMGGWFGAYNFRCQPVDTTSNVSANRMARVVWFYYISKLTEFFDTIFFVFRKKFENVSVLHVSHHGVMPINAWLTARYVPGGHNTLIGFLNSFVHVGMYFYYMMAALGPHYQKWVWWKKYLTHIQMIQFVILFAHSMQLFFVDCNFPIIFPWLIAFQTASFLLLFMNFYRKAYFRKGKVQLNNFKSTEKHSRSTPSIKNKLK